MAVVAMWQCDRDGSMFADRKEAEAYDRMLELAEAFSAVIEAQSNGVPSEEAERLGQFFARHKEAVLAACRGKPEALGALATEEPAVEVPVEATDGKRRKRDGVVTPLVSKG